MIGDALYDLLSTNADISVIVDGRVTPVKFPQKGLFPALTYNTRGVRPIGCRGNEKSKTGTLEIGILASDSVELELLADTLTETLGNYEGTHAGYALSFEATDDDFDEAVEDLTAYYKALQFVFYATKL